MFACVTTQLYIKQFYKDVKQTQSHVSIQAVRQVFRLDGPPLLTALALTPTSIELRQQSEHEAQREVTTVRHVAVC